MKQLQAATEGAGGASCDHLNLAKPTVEIKLRVFNSWGNWLLEQLTERCAGLPDVEHP